MPSSETSQAHALIPGAYERNTLTHRQLGGIGGPAFGSSVLPVGRSSLSAATMVDREMEGGGGVSQRSRRRAVPQPEHAGTPEDSDDNTIPSTGVHSWLPLWRRLVRR